MPADPLGETTYQLVRADGRECCPMEREPSGWFHVDERAKYNFKGIPPEVELAEDRKSPNKASQNARSRALLTAVSGSNKSGLSAKGSLREIKRFNRTMHPTHPQPRRHVTLNKRHAKVPPPFPLGEHFEKTPNNVGLKHIEWGLGSSKHASNYETTQTWLLLTPLPKA